MKQATQPQAQGGFGDDGRPLFKPFAWVKPSNQRGPHELMSDVRDIAAGTALALEMVYRGRLNRALFDPQMLDEEDELTLTRMAIASMNCITGRIDRHFDHLNDPASVPAAEIDVRP